MEVYISGTVLSFLEVYFHLVPTPAELCFEIVAIHECVWLWYQFAYKFVKYICLFVKYTMFFLYKYHLFTE